MTDRPTALNRRPEPAPFVAAERREEEALATDIDRIKEAISGFADSEIRCAVYLKPHNGVGAWTWCDDATLPIDMPVIMSEMKDRFGPGNYELRVSAKGKLRGNATFSIAKEKTTALAAAPAAPAAAMGTAEIFALMMQQNDSARREASQAADRQMTLITGLVSTLAPLLLNRPQPQSTSAAEIAALVTALRPEGAQGGGLKDTLEAMAAFKTLMAGDEGGGGKEGGGDFDINDLIGSGARLAGPAMKALGDYIANNRRPVGETVGPSASLAGEPQAAPGQLALGAAVSRFRLIELVKVDVTYGFARGHDPEKIADLVYDVVEANNVTGAEIDELAANFALSPTGLEDLAREGIDLRSNPQWAAEFFAALHAIHTSPEDDSDGAGGGAPDA